MNSVSISKAPAICPAQSGHSNTMVVTTFFFFTKMLFWAFSAYFSGILSLLKLKLIDINEKMLSRNVKMSTHLPRVVSTVDHLVILQICKEITARFSLSVCVLEVIGWINYLYCERSS